MDESKNQEYIFWLNAWRDRSVSFLFKKGQFKCVITRSKINVIPVESDPEKALTIDISLIHRCKIFSNGRYPTQYVEVSLDDRKILLCPVNPFDPNHIVNGNQNEASAMIKTVDAFHLNMDPQVDTNPYERQMAMKDNLKRFKLDQMLMDDHLERLKAFNQKWDARTSPWTYYDLYGEKFLFLKTIAKIVALVFILAIIVTTLILGIVYVLDALNII